MKTNSSKIILSILLCGILLVASFLFLPLNAKAEEVSAPSIAIEFKKTGTENEFSFQKGQKVYEYPDNGDVEDVTLCVTDFVPSDNSKYSVAYYYYKQSSNAIIYTELSTVEYKDEDGKRNFEYKYNFFKEAGSGIFQIKAIILKDNNVYAFPNDFLLTIKPPAVEVKNTKIVMNNLGTFGGEYPKYHLKAQVYKDKEKGTFEDISKCQIDWWYWLNNQKHYLGTGEDIYWNPAENGDYKIDAIINMGTEDGVVTASTDTVWIAKNYSFYAIIALAGIAVILTAIVVITTVRKVKKERVW